MTHLRRLDGDYPLAYAPDKWDDMPCFFCQRAPMGGGEEGTTCDHCEILYHHHDDQSFWSNDAPCNRFGQFVALAVKDDGAYVYEDRLRIVGEAERSELVQRMLPVLFGDAARDYDGYIIMAAHGKLPKCYVPMGAGARLDDSTTWLWHCEHCNQDFGGHCD